jgi:hypothetical protein
MDETQHKTGGIQILLLGVLLFILIWPAPKPSGFDDPAAPPTGIYHCWAGGFDHLAAGSLTLAPGGRYESYRPGGGGSYSFLPGASIIEFLDGDYHYWEYRGVYQRTHVVALRSAGQDNTLRTNSTRPDQPGERIVLMPVGVNDPIGAERPGQYQYCYRDDAAAKLSAR